MAAAPFEALYFFFKMISTNSDLNDGSQILFGTNRVALSAVYEQD